ncbi:MAG: peptide chain release factor N(5)-glutamine methyltransferase [Gemmataceae bacterium]
MSEPVWTIRDLLGWTTDYLAKKGASPSTARLEAQLLLAHVLRCKKVDLLVRFEEIPPEPQRAAFRELIKRRTDGLPVAYLVGSREFYMLEFEVSPAVLVPRPETESLVAEALQLLKPLAAPMVLDLCTGSGCIGVSIAHQKTDARVTLADVSPDALDVARRNAKKHGVESRLQFRQGDLFAALPAGSLFDAILCNPPYIAPGELATLAPDVREHEPRLALDGGPDGLAFYRRLAADAARHLNPGGVLLMEIGSTQEDAVRAIFAEKPEFEMKSVLKDSAGLPRVAIVRKK